MNNRGLSVGTLFWALILLFMLTVVFYYGDPIMSDTMSKFQQNMGSNETIYQHTLRNWRMVVPGFLLAIVLLIFRATREGGQGTMDRGYGGLY